MENVKAPTMKRSSVAFLQAVIVLIGMGALAFLLWEPHVEGVNAHAAFFAVYLDFFVAYVYVAAIPFFVGLYQAFRVLGYVGQNKVFTPEAVRALRIIKYCGLVIIVFVAVSVVFMIGGDRDDRPAGVFMRVLVSFPAIIVATAAAMFERILQKAVDMKSENDLTV